MKFYNVLKNFLCIFLSFLILLSTPSWNYAQVIPLVRIASPVAQLGIPFTSFFYNDYGQVTRTTDPNGNITEYQYYPDTGYLWNFIFMMATQSLPEVEKNRVLSCLV